MKASFTSCIVGAVLLALLATTGTVAVAVPAADERTTIIPAVVSPTPAASGFSQSCSQISLSGTTLNANCRNTAGGSVGSSLNLNSCVTNNGGHLQCQAGGNFGASCSGCTMDSPSGSIMTCNCSTGPNSAGIRGPIDLMDDGTRQTTVLEIITDASPAN
ncbi:Cyanovirin-N [Mycena rebaudengoi]|nr:Cyanovirin-N [Mycena rebaudengoi]